MEKPGRSKSNSSILFFLPRATSIFQNQHFSPGRDKLRAHNNTGRGLSGPAEARRVSIVPTEARRKMRIGSFDTLEPASPKVSCIGQIKLKKMSKEKCATPPVKAWPSYSTAKQCPTRRSEGDAYAKMDEVVAKGLAPSLGQLRRFSSAREAFANFDRKGGGYWEEEDEDDKYKGVQTVESLVTAVKEMFPRHRRMPTYGRGEQ